MLLFYQSHISLMHYHFFPLTVKAIEAKGTIAVELAHWHIEFFQLEATEGGYRLQEPKKICGCQIWTGKPYIKQLDTGEAMIRTLKIAISLYSGGG